MPELPEVETTRRHLQAAVEGETLAAVEVRRERMVRRNAKPSDVSERLRDKRVVHVGRRGKFILAEMEGDMWWVTHLGMSGRIRMAQQGEPLEMHANVLFDLASGIQVRLIDPRTFGFVAAWTPDELESNLATVGPDALDSPPSIDQLVELLRGRRAPIKALLLDQRVMSGLGNIYADEVLIRAGVHPSRAAGSLAVDEVARMLEAVRPVLEAGIQHGGTSLDDLAYLLPDGRAGEYLSRLWAYGRTGEPCPNCGAPIERTIVAQRSSHFCPSCQPLAPPGRRRTPGRVT